MSSRRKKSSKNSTLRKTLTLVERIKVIRRHEKVPSIRDLARIFDCSTTQIKNILRRRSEYLEEFANNGNLGRIKRRQSARFLTVGVVTCEWLYRMRRKGLTVDDDSLIAMAKKIVEKLNMVTEVRPNNKWLERLRLKFKISDEELEEMLWSTQSLHSSEDESLEVDDIIQDLRNSCPEKDMLVSSLAFPYDITNRYLKETEDDDHDLAKARMKSCLEEAICDKYLQANGVGVSTAQETNEDYIYVGGRGDDGDEGDNDDDDFGEGEDDMMCAMLFPADQPEETVTVKAEVADFYEDSYQSGKSGQSSGITETEASIALLNEKQSIYPMGASAVCLKEEVLAKGIRSYREAYNILGPMEHFALAQEDVRAVGLINQLENHYREMMMRMGNN